MSIAKIMTTHIISVTADETIGKMNEIFHKRPIHHLLVMDGDHLLGIISDRDILRNLSPFANTQLEDAKDRFMSNRKASKIMKTNIVTVPTTASIRDAAKAMVENGVSLLPVIDQNARVAGVLSWKDVLKFLSD